MLSWSAHASRRHLPGQEAEEAGAEALQKVVEDQLDGEQEPVDELGEALEEAAEGDDEGRQVLENASYCLSVLAVACFTIWQRLTKSELGKEALDNPRNLGDDGLDLDLEAAIVAAGVALEELGDVALGEGGGCLVQQAGDGLEVGGQAVGSGLLVGLRGIIGHGRCDLV